MKLVKLDYENRFGRRPTRGLRPWLLIPKLLAVAVYFGALCVLLLIWTMRPPTMGIVILTREIVLKVMVPALLVAMALGLMLFLQHPRQFARMRWLQLKLAIIVVYVPTAHLFLASRLGIIRDLAIATNPQLDPQAVLHFRIGLAAAILMSTVIIILGRLKPRLGQNWARDYRATEPTSAPSSLPSPTCPSASPSD